MYLDDQAIRSFAKLLEDHQTVIIHRHVRPDPDAIGSQLGLAELIKQGDPNKRVLAAGSQSAGLSWLGEMDPVSREDYQDALVIVVDTANQERIDGKDYQQGAALVKIDHHLLVDDYGEVRLLQDEASSTAEIITYLALALKDHLPLNQKASQLLYAGIVGDTGRFQFSNTTSQTFEMVAELMKMGIDAVGVNRQMSEIDFATLQFEAYMVDQMQVHERGVASIRILLEDIQRFGLTDEDTNGITNLPGRVKGILSWVIFIEQASNSMKYRARIRSKGPAINQLAAQYQGGGHAMASGAKVQDEAEGLALIADLVKTNQAYLQQKQSVL